MKREHHAIHGILQSEAYGEPCIFGWERRYLPSELMPLFHKWRSLLSVKAGQAGKGATRNYERTEFHKQVSRDNRRKWNDTDRAKAIPALQRKLCRPIEVTTPEGRLLTYPSLKAACAELGLNSPNLSAVLNGGRPHHKNHKARYLT